MQKCITISDITIVEIVIKDSFSAFFSFLSHKYQQPSFSKNNISPEGRLSHLSSWACNRSRAGCSEGPLGTRTRRRGRPVPSRHRSRDACSPSSCWSERSPRAVQSHSPVRHWSLCWSARSPCCQSSRLRTDRKMLRAFHSSLKTWQRRKKLEHDKKNHVVFVSAKIHDKATRRRGKEFKMKSRLPLRKFCM